MKLKYVAYAKKNTRMSDLKKIKEIREMCGYTKYLTDNEIKKCVKKGLFDVEMAIKIIKQKVKNEPLEAA